MLRTVTEDLYQRLMTAFPATQAYPRSALAQPPMPASVAHFLTQTLERRLHLELDNLSESPWFDYTAEAVTPTRQAFANQVLETAQIPQDEWAKTLQRAVRLVTAFLVQPGSTLSAFVFNGKDEQLPMAIIRRRMGYFLNYPYLHQVFDMHVERRDIREMEPVAFSSLIQRIEVSNRKNNGITDWIAQTQPLFQLIQMGQSQTDAPRLPAELLQLFFEAKGEYEIANRVSFEAEVRNNRMITAEGLEQMLHELQTQKTSATFIEPAEVLAPPPVSLPEPPPVPTFPPRILEMTPPEPPADETPEDALPVVESEIVEEPPAPFVEEETVETEAIIEEETVETEAFTEVAPHEIEEALEIAPASPSLEEETPTDLVVEPIHEMDEEIALDEEDAPPAKSEEEVAAATSVEPDEPSPPEPFVMSTLEPQETPEQELSVEEAADVSEAVEDVPQSEEKNIPLWQKFAAGPAKGEAEPPAAMEQTGGDFETSTKEIFPLPPGAGEPQWRATPESTKAPDEALPIWMQFQQSRTEEDTEALDLNSLETRVFGDALEDEKRDWFVRELFVGRADFYEEILRKIHMAPTWTSASQIIAEKVFMKFKVNIYGEPAVAFTDLVQQQYTQTP